MSLSAQLSLQCSDFLLQIDLELGPGEVLALSGPNGAGKTSLLRVLAGLEPQARGSLVLSGCELQSMPTAERPIGMVFQDLRLLPWSSCLRNVALGLPGPRSRAQAQAREWLDRLGVGHLAGASASRISGGQAQRVAVARALARLPRLLLLDEALSAIDPDSVADVRACVLQHVHTTGAVAVWVTHEPYEQQTWASNHLRLAGRRA